MSKIITRFLLVFLLSILFSQWIFAANDINIIKRSEWWADETWRFRDSAVWKNYFERLKNQEGIEKTEAQNKQEEKLKSINDLLSTDYKDDNTLNEIIYEEDWHKLFWPIQKTNYVKSIVVHHTDTSTWSTSLEAIRAIYKYHTLTRWWGDIGYNYLIWFDWEIFEWRAWWDYVVWAHALWNNRSTAWIAIIWKFQDEKISAKQYESLNKLITFLVNKYWINVNNKFDYHRDCLGNKCSFFIENYKDDAIVWHKDVWHTNCPWEELYKQLQDLKKELSKYSTVLRPIKNWTSTKVVSNDLDSKLSKLSEYDLLRLLAAIDYKLDSTNEIRLKYLRDRVFKKISGDVINSNAKTNVSYDKNTKIKVKLSYPISDSISIKKWDNNYDIKVQSWKLLINNKITLESLTAKSTKWSYLEISSWDRKPSWDTKKLFNDNKFRGNLILTVENWKLLVVNEVFMSDYLKWLWEVSNDDNPEKIKTIIIAARTYARWYVEKANKFPWESYHASDNPDEFQLYLWYSLEQRSPKILKIVDSTIDQVITYNSDIIKPWYFTQSDWKTLSFKDYCKINSSACKNINYPYLTATFDPGSIWKTKLWHWVWISGAGATYLAKKWWTSEMIIKYYLKWVKIKTI